MSRISLCMIVKNEEKYLEGCLQSVKGIVDEIILVDTGSTDSTLSIAARNGAVIFNVPWCNDFSAARNESLQHAQGDWILYLDADERFSSGQSAALVKLLQDHSAFAYSIWIEGIMDGREGGLQQRNAYPRLFRNHPHIRFEGRVHEQITPSLERHGYKIIPTDLVIEHLGYNQGYSIVAEKVRRNCELLRKQVEENPLDSYSKYQLGNSLSIIGDYDNAYAAIVETLGTKGLSTSVAASAFNILAEIDIRRNHLDEAMKNAQSSLKLAQNQMLAKWFLVVACIGKKEYSRALELLEVMHQKQGNKSITTAHDVFIDEWKIQYQSAVCLWELGKKKEALECLLRSQKLNPKDGTLYDREIQWRIEHNTLTEVAEVLEKAKEHNVLSYPLFKRAIDAALKTGEVISAIAFLKMMNETISMQIPEEVRPRLESLTARLDKLVAA